MLFWSFIDGVPPLRDKPVTATVSNGAKLHVVTSPRKKKLHNFGLIYINTPTLGHSLYDLGQDAGN